MTPASQSGGASILARRLLWVVLLAGGAFAIIDSSIRLFLQYRQDMGTLGHQVEHLLESHRSSLSMSLYRLDENQLQAELKDLVGHLGLLRLEVFEPSSTLPIHVSVGEIGSGPLLRLQDTLWIEEAGQRRNLGFLAMDVDAEWPLRELRRGAVFALLSQGASLLILALIVLGIVHFSINRHLIGITHQLEQVSFAGLTSRIKLKKKIRRPPDEIDRLRDALNALMQRLEDGQRQNEWQEAKRLEMEKRHQSDRKLEALGTLAGGIAHDINNILGIILLQTELARDSVDAQSACTARLDVVLKAVDRAKEVVRQILVFSRNSDGKRVAQNVTQTVQDALVLLKSTVPMRVHMRAELEPECGVLKAEPADLQQILLNLGVNAFQAMEEKGGSLMVGLRLVHVDEGELLDAPQAKAGLHAMLTVVDTGPGMDKGIAERIFEPYFTTKEAGKGTGLGLAVVHGIVTKLQGHILVHSEPGRGTTFRVLLPVQEGHVDNAAGAPTFPTGQGEHLLLAEDEPLLRSAMQDILTGLGYRVTACENGQLALEALQRKPSAYDMLITDLSMPVMGGADLAESALVLRPDLPIAVCTGFAQPGEFERLQVRGIRILAGKPFLRSELAQAIRELLPSKAENPTQG